jgi:cytochrome c553
MIQNRFPTVFSVLIVLAALTAPARAAEGAPDPGSEREFGARLQVCGACHGTNGMPKSANIPIIWGQDETYLVKQLHDFGSGDRKFEVMEWMAKSLEPPQQAPTASFFAKKSWPAKVTPAAATTMPRGMAICQACHQPNFTGGLQVPRIAGQNYDYLIEAMRRFASGERSNNADMVKIMQGISPADRETMAHYLAGL